MQSLDELTAKVPEIEPGAKYWFFRTDGGDLFRPFIGSASIAFGYPKITLKALHALPGENYFGHLKDLVAKSYPENKTPGLAASQLIRFLSEMKPGDYVLIPSERTEDIAVGMISTGPPFEEVLKSEGVEFQEYIKRRKVKWIGRYRRDEFNAKVWRILITHQTIVDATPYAQWIDQLLFDFFKKGEQFHYVVRIAEEDNISARVLFQACLELLELGDEYAAAEKIEGNGDQVDVKINLESPGTVELIAHTAQTAQILGIIALGIICLNGGGLKLKVTRLGINLDLRTDGLIKKINDFLNSNSERALRDSLRTKIDRLKVEDSKEIIKLLDASKK
jgi:restriction system protein